VPMELATFLAMPPSEQTKYFESEIPEVRGSTKGPLRPLMNAIQSYLPYYFDYYPDVEGNAILERLSAAIGRVVRNRLSRSDFESGSEWEELRMVARAMLLATNAPACTVSCPLPLKDWVDHFDWSQC
jgi:hypothetical protein